MLVLFQFPMADDGEDFEDDVNSVMFDSNGYYSENGDIARRKEAKNATNKVRRQVNTIDRVKLIFRQKSFRTNLSG